MGLHQTQKVFHNKGNHQQIERQPTEWENRFADYAPCYIRFPQWKASDMIFISPTVLSLIDINDDNSNNSKNNSIFYNVDIRHKNILSHLIVIKTQWNVIVILWMENMCKRN